MFVAILFAAAACGDSTDQEGDFPQIEPGAQPGRAVQIVRSDSKPDGSEPDLETGAEITTPSENRRAIVALLRGEYESKSDKPYSAELVRTIDADVYRDIDRGTNGPDHWITRAKVLDADGNVLWTDHVNSFFQLLEYLKLVLDETSSVNFTLLQVFSYAKGNYPGLLEFPVQIPVGLEGASTYILEVPDQSGDYYEVYRGDIQKMIADAEPPKIDAEVQTIAKNGPASDRIDVAILGDGYTASQRNEFIGDARAIAERMVQTEPFASHEELFNFKAVWTPSAESGAGYDCRGPDDSGCKQDFRDTYYRYVFVVSALIDQFGLNLPPASARVAMPLEIDRMVDAAALAGADETLMVSNTDRRSGFAGMYAGVLTAFDNRDDFPDVAVHEFGHSFGVLGDEYFVPSDACLHNAPRVPLPANIAEEVSEGQLKWNHWVDEETPLPTPTIAGHLYDVGAYRRAYNCTFLFRPSETCKMRNSSKKFCPVCKEQLARRLYNDIDLLRSGYPTATRTANGGLIFEIGARANGEIVDTRWILGGEKLAEGSELRLQGSEVPSSWTKLEAVADGSGSFVRKEAPRVRESFTWWVRSR